MTTRRALRRKIDRIADQLQILEMYEGWHYMMGSRLNQQYELLREQYENRAGRPYRYGRN